MTINTGTLVIAPIRPNDSADTYPAAYANEIAGGWHQTATISALSDISADRLVTGMASWVVSTNSIYVYGTSSWSPLSFSALSTITGHTYLGNNTSAASVATALTVAQVRTDILPLSEIDGLMSGSVANATYTISLYANAAGTVNFVKTQLSAGTLSAKLQINGVDVGSSTVSTTTSIGTGTCTSSNSIAIGDKMSLVVASAASASDFAFTIGMTLS